MSVGSLATAMDSRGTGAYKVKFWRKEGDFSGQNEVVADLIWDNKNHQTREETLDKNYCECSSSLPSPLLLVKRIKRHSAVQGKGFIFIFQS